MDERTIILSSRCKAELSRSQSIDDYLCIPLFFSASRSLFIVFAIGHVVLWWTLKAN